MKKINLKVTITLAFSIFSIFCTAQNWLIGGNNNFQLFGNTTPSIGTNQNRPLLINTNGAERMRILGNNGFVGVNTNAPTRRVDINGDLRIRTTAVNTTSNNILVERADGTVDKRDITSFNLITTNEFLQQTTSGELIIKNPNGIILLAEDGKAYYRLKITAEGKIITELANI